MKFTWRTFQIFIIFFAARWRGKGESEAPGGGGSVFIENPTGEGGFSRRGRGREGVCGELGNLGGGGFFFCGPETSTKTYKS